MMPSSNTVRTFGTIAATLSLAASDTPAIRRHASRLERVLSRTIRMAAQMCGTVSRRRAACALEARLELQRQRLVIHAKSRLPPAATERPSPPSNCVRALPPPPKGHVGLAASKYSLKYGKNRLQISRASLFGITAANLLKLLQPTYWNFCAAIPPPPSREFFGSPGPWPLS